MRVLASIIGMILSVSVLAEAPRFKLMTENFPPFNFSINNKNFEHNEADIRGLCTEIVQEVFKNDEISYKLKLRQWDYAYGYAQKKPNRGVFCTTRTESREPLFKWVGPLASNDWVIFGLDSFSGNIRTESDLKQYKIGAYKGDVRSEYMKGQGMNISELTDDRLNPERLEEGMIDLWIASSFTGPRLAKEAGVNNLKRIFIVKEAQLYLALHPGTDDQWVNKLNEELRKLKSSGFVSELASKYE